MSTGKYDIDFWANVLTRFGLSGFLLVFIVLMIWTSASIEQKQQFIDIYILFKPIGGDCGVYLKIVLIMLGIIIYEAIFFRRRLLLKKDRIDEIAEERTRLQELLYKQKPLKK